MKEYIKPQIDVVDVETESLLDTMSITVADKPEGRNPEDFGAAKNEWHNSLWDDDTDE